MGFELNTNFFFFQNSLYFLKVLGLLRVRIYGYLASDNYRMIDLCIKKDFKMQRVDKKSIICSEQNISRNKYILL